MSFECLIGVGKEHLTCAVFGGKNSKEKDGFPVRADSASLSLMCILKLSNGFCTDKSCFVDGNSEIHLAHQCEG